MRLFSFVTVRIVAHSRPEAALDTMSEVFRSIFPDGGTGGCTCLEIVLNAPFVRQQSRGKRLTHRSIDFVVKHALIPATAHDSSKVVH